MALFKPPQKKKNVGNIQYRPFPIPIASITNVHASTTEWNYFEGFLRDDFIHVTMKGDAHALRSQGFFGKAKTARQTIEVIEAQSHESEETADNIGYLSQSNCDVSMNEETAEESDPHVELRTLETEVEQGSDELHLSFEEGFFLSYALGCLFIKSEDSTCIDILDQWRIFCERKPNFPVLYSVYHHFRSKGWVPTDGLRYGSDLVLYKKGPPFYHSSYIVVIQTVDGKTMKEKDFNGVKNRSFSWVTLSGLLRLATTVSKEVMFCYVLIPHNLSEEEISTPDIIRKLNIRERIISRWTSSKNRERELTDIDCDY